MNPSFLSFAGLNAFIYSICDEINLLILQTWSAKKITSCAGLYIGKIGFWAQKSSQRLVQNVDNMASRPFRLLLVEPAWDSSLRQAFFSGGEEELEEESGARLSPLTNWLDAEMIIHLEAMKRNPLAQMDGYDTEKMAYIDWSYMRKFSNRLRSNVFDGGIKVVR